MTRTNTEKLNGIVPGATSVAFGGREFAIKEPGMFAYAPILDAVMAVESLDEEKASNREKVKATYEAAITMIENWDGEIGENREWIAANGTPAELMAFFGKAVRIVVLPLANLPEQLGMAPAKKNRAQRRAKSGR